MAPTKAQLAKLKAAEAAALKRAEAANTLPDERGKKTAAAAAVTAAQSVGIPTTTAPAVKSNTPKLDAVKATNAARVAADAKLKEDLKPKNPAPPGTYYQWHVFAGGGGEYRLINIPGYVAPGARGGGGGGNGGAGGGGGGGGDVIPTKITDPAGPSTNVTVLKSLLKGMGFNSKIIDSSSSFLMSLLSEGLDYDNAISIFLDSKDYTLKSGSVVTSPFYQEYGFLNEGLVNAKSASELYNFVEGSKGIIDKYGLSSKFLSTDSLKKYVKNNITVKDLDERANAARLKAINADPAYVQSLKILGFLGSSADLTDFYLDPTIGKESLELKRSTGAFTAEALRRANAKITTDKEDLMRFERITAGLQAKGLSEAQIGQAASEGFENIAQTLAPSVGLSNIFEGKQAATAQTIQQELEAEQFMGTASERRKKLTELGTKVFQAQTGRQTRNDSIYGQV